MYNLPPPLTRIEMELPAPAKEFKAVNNSISKVIRVMVAKSEDSVSEVWDGSNGSNAERTQKYGGSKYKMTYIRPNIYIKK